MFLRQGPDGDRAVQTGVAGHVHVTRAAGPDGGKDLVRVEASSRGETQGNLRTRGVPAKTGRFYTSLGTEASGKHSRRHHEHETRSPPGTSASADSSIIGRGMKASALSERG